MGRAIGGPAKSVVVKAVNEGWIDIGGRVEGSPTMEDILELEEMEARIYVDEGRIDYFALSTKESSPQTMKELLDWCKAKQVKSGLWNVEKNGGCSVRWR